MSIFRKIARKARKSFCRKEANAWIRDYPAMREGTRQGLQNMCAELLQLTGNTIFGGPFAGMSLPLGSSLCKQPNVIIGSYEEEVHDVINEIVCNPPTCVVDIGSAHGIYPVGLARLIKEIPIIAFEMNEDMWPEIALLAEANSVLNRIKQHGLCTVHALDGVLSDNAFVISDCEGAEDELLDPVAVPSLQSALIVCELHEFYKPGITAMLVERFRRSHQLEIRCEKLRNPSGYRILRNFPSKFRHVMCDETRHTHDPFALTAGRFMIMRPKHALR